MGPIKWSSVSIMDPGGRRHPKRMLDIRTLSLATSVISLAIMIVMLHIHSTHRIYKGFFYWVVASVFMFVGLTLMSLRGLVPDLLSIIVANGLMIAQYAFVTRGLFSFFDRKSRDWVYPLLFLIYVPSISYYTYMSPDLSMRIVIISVLAVFLCLLSIVLIHRYSQRIRITVNFLLVMTFSVFIVYGCIRIVYTVYLEEQITDFMMASSMQGVMFLVLIYTNIMMFIGLIMLNQQAMERDYLESEKEVRTLRGVIPICMHCKEIRTDDGYWEHLEKYLSDHADVSFTHSICDSCREKYYPEVYQQRSRKSEDSSQQDGQ